MADASPQLPEGNITAAGSAQQPLDAGSTGSPKRRPRSSRFDVDYGRRDLKAYPMTEGELHALAALGIAGTVAFSLAAGFLGFALDLHKDLAMASDVPESAAAFWGAVRVMSFVGAVAMAIVGTGCIVAGHVKVSNIKKETTFHGG